MIDFSMCFCVTVVLEEDLGLGLGPGALQQCLVESGGPQTASHGKFPRVAHNLEGWPFPYHILHCMGLPFCIKGSAEVVGVFGHVQVPFSP